MTACLCHYQYIHTHTHTDWYLWITDCNISLCNIRQLFTVVMAVIMTADLSPSSSSSVLTASLEYMALLRFFLSRSVILAATVSWRRIKERKFDPWQIHCHKPVGNQTFIASFLNWNTPKWKKSKSSLRIHKNLQSSMTFSNSWSSLCIRVFHCSKSSGSVFWMSFRVPSVWMVPSFIAIICLNNAHTHTQNHREKCQCVMLSEAGTKSS